MKVNNMDELAGAAGRIASAIFPSGVGMAQDTSGGTVGSLTEAVMGITAGLFEVASAIRELADSNKPTDNDCYPGLKKLKGATT